MYRGETQVRRMPNMRRGVKTLYKFDNFFENAKRYNCKSSSPKPRLYPSSHDVSNAHLSILSNIIPISVNPFFR